jgi:cytochrome oxidase Cu insertion factor (SCO1/SenC/PrrC family)
MIRFRCCFAVAAFALLAGSAGAQPSSQRGGFNVPEVGSKLPSVQVFDEQGQPFSTDRLRDQYTVLVFGCLT